MTKVKYERSWLWGGLFVAMGLLYIGTYVYRGRTEIQSLLNGMGFLLIAPHASFRFPVGHMVTLGVAMLGLLLLVLSLFVR